MSTRQLAKLLAIAAVAAVSVAAFAATADPVQADPAGFTIVPTDETYGGKTYQWYAKKWHQWVLQQPTDASPMLDTTGEHCAQGQHGDVWFLTGVIGAGAVTRECTVPSDKALFFPVYNWMWWPWPIDPPLSEAEMEYWEEWLEGATQGMSGSAKIDHKKVRNLPDYQVNSAVWFDVDLPEDDLVDYLFQATYYPDDEWGEETAGPLYNDGVYLLVEPLEEGEHTIQLKHSYGLNVTYELTIED